MQLNTASCLLRAVVLCSQPLRGPPPFRAGLGATLGPRFERE
jgi:hypothetical protein